MDSNAAQFSREDDKECQLVPAAAAEEPSRPLGSVPQAASGEAGPGCPGTTQDSISHIIKLRDYPECTVSGSIDWFEWTGLIDFSGSASFESICREFQFGKEYCQVEKRAYYQAFVPNFGPVRVRRIGVNRGGDRGHHFEYRLNVPGATYGLSHRSGDELARGKKRQQANFYVLQTGRDCLLHGAEHGYQQALKFLDALGGVVKDLKVSRGDLCLDVVNLNAADLMSLVAKGHFITAARNVHPNINYVTDSVTGFVAGKAPIRLIVYDKIQERMGKADSLYLRALVDRRWYGVTPASATRIEYQMLRRWLLEKGIASPEDFLSTRGTLVHELTYDWFRLTARRVDRRNKHQSRAKTHPIWIGVQQGFQDIFGKPEGALRPIRRDKVSPTKLSEQGRGCFANALLQMDMPYQTYGEFAEMCKRLILAMPASKAEAGAFMEELERRKMEFETT
jgi:hypothetical protein